MGSICMLYPEAASLPASSLNDRSYQNADVVSWPSFRGSMSSTLARRSAYEETTVALLASGAPSRDSDAETFQVEVKLSMVVEASAPAHEAACTRVTKEGSTSVSDSGSSRAGLTGDPWEALIKAEYAWMGSAKEGW
ncbi:hypothetical protein AK812_SmicGene35784 [Symbiodinium microadriaticum]|uniref:Uncharacterized protein n=1 Tax=Symbiodinium microadriaticum TaxID=2951 RepID=A0A1Q9CKL3_SYMMI|nr:hypothetical protein AK812_SmicGene35784 [Symbiodinium microadriaticum]